MNWSFRIARIAGIDIKVHVTFFLILILGALPWGSQFGLPGALFGIALILLLFLCVTLHELGHGLAARYYDIPVREIILLPLGGLAMLGRNPSKPIQELVIALAGPLVNVIIALLLLLVTSSDLMLGGLSDTTLMNSTQEPSLSLLLLWLLQANIALVIFNMIPAFPLDGGRVLRAVLAMVMPAQRATAIATSVGQGIAILLGLYGVLNGNFMLVLVAIFIFFGAGQENVEGQARTVLTTLRVGDAYNKHALTLQIGDRVSKVVDYILTSYQPDFAVMQGSHPLGIVTRDDVLNALSSAPDDQYVTLIMRREVLRLDANASLDTARQQIAEKGVRVGAVYSGEAYLGLVSLEDIAEAYAVLSFQQRQQLLAQGAKQG